MIMKGYLLLLQCTFKNDVIIDSNIQVMGDITIHQLQPQYSAANCIIYYGKIFVLLGCCRIYWLQPLVKTVGVSPVLTVNPN